MTNIENTIDRIQELIENGKKLLIDQFSMRSDSPFGRNLRYLFKFLEPKVIRLFNKIFHKEEKETVQKDA